MSFSEHAFGDYDRSKRMPDLKQLSDDDFEILVSEIGELDRFNDYPSNYLGADGHLRERVNRAQTDESKATAQAALERYRELSKKYPWYTHRPSADQLQAEIRISQALAAQWTGSATADHAAEQDYYIQQSQRKKYSSDHIREEQLRRMGLKK